MSPKSLLYIAYGWLFVSGLLHYLIDVVSHYLRGVRAASAETTLYYGLHAAYSLGQIAFAGLALIVLWNGAALATQRSSIIFSMAMVAGWLAISFAFSDYPWPRVHAAVVLAALVGALTVS